MIYLPGMTNAEVRAAKRELRNKIKSLRNDCKCAFYDLKDKGIQPAPFPIMMFAMSVLDYFSSLLEGWSDGNPRMRRFQTTRMVTFCQNELGYGNKESRILVKIYRHSLMHTSGPKTIRDKQAAMTVGWSISDYDSQHMNLMPYPALPDPSIRLLHVGIKQLIRDLGRYLEGSSGYFIRLSTDPQLQQNFEDCKREISSQVL